MEQTSGEENAVLSIPVSKRSDTGKYTVNLSNKFGEDSGDLKIIVLGAFKSAICTQQCSQTGILMHAHTHAHAFTVIVIHTYVKQI